MIEEIWKSIINYEGFYEVSNWGRIKSLQYHGKIREKILKPCKNQNWKSIRFFVDLKKNNIKNRFYVHQLVATAFIGPCPPDMEVCHNDGDATNNFADNLRYGTHKENMQDMIKHGTNNGKGLIGQENTRAILIDEQVLEICKLINDGIPFKVIAEKFNVSIPVISNIKCKRQWKHLTKDINFLDRKNRGSTKFEGEEIRQIIKLINSGIPSKKIAEQFDCSEATINRIKQGITFKDYK